MLCPRGRSAFHNEFSHFTFPNVELESPVHFYINIPRRCTRLAYAWPYAYSVFWISSMCTHHCRSVYVPAVCNLPASGASELHSFLRGRRGGWCYSGPNSPAKNPPLHRCVWHALFHRSLLIVFLPFTIHLYKSQTTIQDSDGSRDHFLMALFIVITFWWVVLLLSLSPLNGT